MPSIPSHTTPVPLTHSRKTDSLLIGYSIGSAELPHGRKLEIIGSGRVLRFTVTGCEGYVDADLTPLAEYAATLLTKDAAASA